MKPSIPLAGVAAYGAAVQFSLFIRSRQQHTKPGLSRFLGGIGSYVGIGPFSFSPKVPLNLRAGRNAFYDFAVPLTANPKYAGALPGRHLMLQPRLGI